MHCSFHFYTGTAEDYRLLENMNKATLNKYIEMKQITSNISKSIKDLNEKCKLMHYLTSSLLAKCKLSGLWPYTDLKVFKHSSCVNNASCFIYCVRCR